MRKGRYQSGVAPGEPYCNDTVFFIIKDMQIGIPHVVICLELNEITTVESSLICISKKLPFESPETFNRQRGILPVSQQTSVKDVSTGPSVCS